MAFRISARSMAHHNHYFSGPVSLMVFRIFSAHLIPMVAMPTQPVRMFISFDTRMSWNQYEVNVSQPHPLHQLQPLPLKRPFQSSWACSLSHRVELGPPCGLGSALTTPSSAVINVCYGCIWTRIVQLVVCLRSLSVPCNFSCRVSSLN